VNVPLSRQPWFSAALAWYFVVVWGSGFVITKIALQYAPPFTFLTLRFVFGLACVIPVILIMQPRWPATRVELVHVIVAGLLMHAVHLGGSHYTQYLGISAGITALILSAQPLITALIAARWMDERLTRRQWVGVIVGLGGVLLIVWHKIDVHVATAASLLAVTVGLAGVTAGTLYQRAFCPLVDLRSAAFVQFSVNIAVLAPLAWVVEGFTIEWSWALVGAIVFLVIGGSILAVSALHTLMRRGQATRVTSLLYLTPVFAVVVELAVFGLVPSALSTFGIVVTCFGVALVAARARAPASASPTFIHSPPPGQTSRAQPDAANQYVGTADTRM